MKGLDDYTTGSRLGQLHKWAGLVSGRLPQNIGAADGDDDGATRMLWMLTRQLGMKGAPRLQMVILTGSAWALRWLLDSGLVALETPLGGAARLPSLEEGGIDNCGICHDGFLSPVQLPCGHEYCRACIGRCFETGVARCPLCQANVPAPQDVLPQNLAFALADDLRHTDWLPGAVAGTISSVPLGHVLASLAAYRGALAVLELLCDAGIDLETTLSGTNLMHFACMNAQPHVVGWLVCAGHEQMALARSHEGAQAIQYACQSGDYSSLNFLRDLPCHLVRHATKAAEDAQDGLEKLRIDVHDFETQEYPPEEVATFHALLAQKRGELVVAEQRAERASSELAAARARVTPMEAASEGWVEAALSSPFEMVSDTAKEFQAEAASEEALTVTLPRLLAQRAPFAAFVELGPLLEGSRIGRRACWHGSPRESNHWLKVIRDVTEHGRADVMRWFYSPEVSWLYHDFNFDRAVPVFGDHRDFGDREGRETYEGFGRKVAARRDDEDHRSFIRLYDDLCAERAASRAWFDATHGL